MKELLQVPKKNNNTAGNIKWRKWNENIKGIISNGKYEPIVRVIPKDSKLKFDFEVKIENWILSFVLYLQKKN